jgi:hypothetical protein
MGIIVSGVTSNEAAKQVPCRNEDSPLQVNQMSICRRDCWSQGVFDSEI